MTATAPVDPIALELLRTRLDAAAEEGALAIEQTAVSPIVADGKDFSTNIFGADGAVLAGGGKVDYKWSSAVNAVRAVIAAHGDSVAPGDVFAVNDPHHGGGNHAQDIEICRPVFRGEEVVGWVGASAHLIDVGGMTFGSWAPDATECFQEALRFPPVRLVRRGEECSDVWSIILNNVRLPGLVEMDMRGLIAGCEVTARKVLDIVESLGPGTYRAAAQALCASTEAELRRRIEAIADGDYAVTGWIEWGEERLELPCRLQVDGGELRYDFTGAPPQVPHFINSKAYIVRGEVTAEIRSLLAPDLPFCQGIFPPVVVECPTGTVVDSIEPAPIGSAHLDVAMTAAVLALQCVQMAMAATPGDGGRWRFNGPPGIIALATHSWSYRDASGGIDGLVVNEGWQAGSSAGWDRDGSDLFPLLVGAHSVLDFVDIEVIEAWYPLEVMEKRCAPGPAGAGRFRSGAGCQLAYRIDVRDGAVGSMLAIRDGIPISGVAGGEPGAPTDFRIRRADGTEELLAAHAAGVRMGRDDIFQMRVGAGGGWGDAVDRDPAAVARDVGQRRLEPSEAYDHYGVVLDAAGRVEEAASARRRQEIRAARLRAARRPEQVAGDPPMPETLDVPEGAPALSHGVVRVGDLAVAVRSGAVLARSPQHWTSGCPVTEEVVVSATGIRWLRRSYLDPLSGSYLHVEAVPVGAPELHVAPAALGGGGCGAGTAVLTGKKLLVTGPAGQIALPMVAALARSNEVWGLARFADPDTRRTVEAAGARPFPCDLAAGDFAGLPEDFDHVLHLATFRKGGLDYDQAMRVNAEGTALLLRHCRRARSVLVMSTFEVYRPKDDPLHAYRESDPLGDSNSLFDPTYSMSKIAEEAVARAFARAYGVPVTIARMNASYGDGGGLLAYHLDWMSAGSPVVVKWDPAMYNPIHTDDIVGQVEAMLGAAGVPATVVNWAGDEAVSAQEWCAFMGELLGVVPRVVVKEVAGGIRGIVSDNTARLALAGPCTVPWREGVRRLVEARRTGGAMSPAATRLLSAMTD